MNNRDKGLITMSNGKEITFPRGQKSHIEGAMMNKDIIKLNGFSINSSFIMYVEDYGDTSQMSGDEALVEAKKRGLI